MLKLKKKSSVLNSGDKLRIIWMSAIPQGFQTLLFSVCASHSLENPCFGIITERGVYYLSDMLGGNKFKNWSPS